MQHLRARFPEFEAPVTLASCRCAVLFAPGCLTAVEKYEHGLTVPREANRLDRMAAEFAATMSDAAAFGKE